MVVTDMATEVTVVIEVMAAVDTVVVARLRWWLRWSLIWLSKGQKNKFRKVAHFSEMETYAIRTTK